MKLLLTALLLAAFCPASQAQDSIRTIDGNTFSASISKVTPYEIKYFNSKNGKPVRPASGQLSHSISTSKVIEIVYADGTRDSMLPLPKIAGDTGSRYFTKHDYYQLGANDARLYYKGYKGATVGTFLATFPGSPLLGLFVAAGTSAARPKPINFMYPNTNLLTSEDYKNGYARQAHHIKARGVWTCWIVGTGLTLVTYFVLLGLSGQHS